MVLFDGDGKEIWWGVDGGMSDGMGDGMREKMYSRYGGALACSLLRFADLFFFPF